MKKKITKSLIAVLTIAIITSCTTSNDVASNRSVQKRKYNKGLFISKNKKINYSKTNTKDEITSTKKVETKLVEELSSFSEKTNMKSSHPIQKLNISKTEKKDQTKNKFQSENKIKYINSSSIVLAENNLIKTNSKSTIIEKAVKHKISKAKKRANNKSDGDIDPVLLYVLAFFVPFLAVGLATNWDVGKVILNLILTFLCVIPGIIHAFIVVSKNT